VLQGSTQEAYANDRWRSQGVDVVAYQNQDLIYPTSQLAVWMRRCRMKSPPAKAS
jgi:hypothetical protein